MTLVLCFFNNLLAMRYLTPLYFCVSLIFALALVGLKKKGGRIAAWGALLFLLAYETYANVEFIRNIPRRDELKKAHEIILSLMEKRGIRGGYAHYVTSYVLTLQSQEKIIVAPFHTQDRYPAYTEYVGGLDRAAYILQDHLYSAQSFQQTLDQHKISYEKVRVEPFWIYFIDRKAGSEKGLV